MKKQRKWTALGRRSMAFLLAAVMVMGCWTPGYAAEEELVAEELVQETAPDTSAPVESTEPAQEELAEVPAEEPEEEPAQVPAEEPEEEPAEQKKTSAVADILKKVSGVVDLPKEEIETTVELTEEERREEEKLIAEEETGKLSGGTKSDAVKAEEINYTDGLTVATDLDGRSYHLFAQRNYYAVTNVVGDNTATNSHDYIGLIANIDTETNQAIYENEAVKIQAVSGFGNWYFESTGTDGEYYIYVKEGTTKKYMKIALDSEDGKQHAWLSTEPIATKVYTYDYSVTTKDANNEDVTTVYKTYLITQTTGGTTYVLNQLGGMIADYNAFGGYNMVSGPYKGDAGNFFLMKETYIAADEKPIPSVAENIKMSLFDYGPLINGTTGLDFMHGGYRTDALDGHPGTNYGTEESLNTTPATGDNGSGRAPAIQAQLVDGYPKTSATPANTADPANLSLDYLFDPAKATITETEYWTNIYPATDNDVAANPYRYKMAAFPIDNANGSGTGLFQMINGYYVYDSAKNAAWYNPNTNKFELYDYVVRPPYTDYLKADSTTGELKKTTDAEIGNFAPFNQGHTTGYEDYGTMTAPNPVKPADQEKRAYRLAGESQATDMNNWFGMKLEFDFNMPSGGIKDGQPMEFDFFGDDDVWVFIDGVLILDIGGTHGAQGAYINFATGEVTNPGAYSTAGEKAETMENRLEAGSDDEHPGTLYSIMKAAGKSDEWLAENFQDINNDGTLDTFKNWSNHKLQFFYMERGGNISYCRLKFNMEPLPDGGARVTKQLSDDSVATALTGDLEYTFKLVKVDGATETPVLVEGKTDANGEFKLKAGESLAFDHLDAAHGGQLYRVYELDDKEYHLDEIVYSGNSVSAGAVTKDGIVQYVEFKIMPEDAENGLIHNSVFVNELETTDFSVHKTVKGNMGDWSKDFSFTATMYTKNPDDGGTVIDFDEDGVWVDGVATFTLKHDETKIFTNIPLGAYVVITEANEGYETSWVVDMENPETNKTVNETYVNSGATATLTTDLDENNDKAYFLNVKDVTIDTGVFLDSAPYIVILAAVVAGAAWLVLRRRNSHEE